ncbi:hypothetical protein CC86DRAFT_401287 [Ophiobolus disseminans]|uniref:Uncharacterized protein n=1 Tax=Ophiobolus disseminans TaxID=1469910 RepID=A0A6A7AGU3_9PLEO|nr:hypothetical protein CC86DRAFT_401287 [Ophiobolus disseminans]
MTITPVPRGPGRVRPILLTKYDDLYRTYEAQQQQISTLDANNQNIELQKSEIETKNAALEEQNTALQELCAKLQDEITTLTTVAPTHEDPPVKTNTDSPEIFANDTVNEQDPPSKTDKDSPETFANDMNTEQDHLQAEIIQKDLQIRMQGGVIADLEAKVKALQCEVTECKATVEDVSSKKNEVCENKCDRMREKLCRLVEAIAEHGDAVERVVGEVMDGVDRGKGCGEGRGGVRVVEGIADGVVGGEDEWEEEDGKYEWEEEDGKEGDDEEGRGKEGEAERAEVEQGEAETGEIDEELSEEETFGERDEQCAGR